MSDDTSAYAVREETIEGATRYYAAFKDGNGIRQETEVNREIYLALNQCRLVEKRQENELDRHWERFELSEAQLAARTFKPPLPMEEAVAQTADMQAALATLTDTQRRRFLLYHEHGLNYEQIAAVEGCKFQVVAKSIEAAKTKLKIFLTRGVKKGGLSEE